MITEEHITAFGWAAPRDLDDIVPMALRINDFLSGLFLGIGLRLVDVRLEFGRLWEDEQMRIVLADEISPDNCRLWDLEDALLQRDVDFRFQILFPVLVNGPRPSRRRSSASSG